MFSRKLQLADGPCLVSERKNEGLLYTVLALGIIAGAALSTYLWRRRARNLELQSTPPERVEEMISDIDRKLADLERAFDDLKANR